MALIFMHFLSTSLISKPSMHGSQLKMPLWSGMSGDYRIFTLMGPVETFATVIKMESRDQDIYL